MLRSLVMIFLLLGPGAALALCEGRDLIETLPQAERDALRRAADDTPFATGILWLATRGATRITWFGTYHYPHERTRAHLDALTPLIETADRVYLEVSNDDTRRMERTMAEDPSIMFITEGPTLPDLLGEADWQSYKAAMAERTVPGFMAAKFKPIWAAMMLGLGPCEARNGALEGDGIDTLIGNHAAAIDNPSRSLEEFRTVLSMLDSFPQEDQLNMIRLFLPWSASADDMAYTLRTRYLAQDVAMIWEYSRKVSLAFGGETAEADFATFEQQFLTNRNRAWVERLLTDAEGKTVFAAVGAAHLPGETGVLSMLEAEGFEIRTLPFTP